VRRNFFFFTAFSSQFARTSARSSNHARLGFDLSCCRLDRRLLGFGGIAGFAVEIAKIIFFVAIALFAISAVIGLMRSRAPTVP
jgi:uncharacterized membrane protein YtjA (UPF0391 family)